MTHLLDKYSRVTTANPCPKCGRGDWCLVRDDGKTCLCTRVKSGKPRKSRQGDVIGWVHYLAEGMVAPVVGEKKPHEYLTPAQISEYIRSHTDNKSDSFLSSHAKRLGLTLNDLRYMQTYYHPEYAALLFPMFNAVKHVTGGRFRRSDGKKWSIAGGQYGVFLSRHFTPDKLVWVTEGPTDAAASCHVGFTNVIGRPNCSTGVEIVSGLMQFSPDTPVVIVADPDDCGQHGGFVMAESIPNPAVVIKGPTDLRKFVCSDLPTVCRRAIVKGVRETDTNAWQPTFRNTRGLHFNFSKVLECKTT